MSCCKNYIGEYPHNETIDTGIKATKYGKYIVRLDFNGSKIVKDIDLYAGENILIEPPFNENYNYTFTIEDPTGSLVAVDGCTTHSLKTYINLNSDCNADRCDD